MDSLTQMALGAAVGQLVAGREVGRSAALLGAICGTLPDLDVLVHYADPVAQMTYHRTWSHSFFWLTLVSPLMWALARLARIWRGGGQRLLLAIWLAFVTHPLLDCFTIYGTQALLPFSDHPLSIGSMFIIDPAFTLALCAGLLAALNFPRSLRARRALAGGLAFCTTYLLVSVVLQRAVIRDAQATWPAELGPLTQLKATPTAFNILRWRVLAINGERHCDQFVGAFSPVDPDGWRCYAQRRDLEARLQDHWPFERLRWFTHGWYAVTMEDERVIVTDLRMGVENFYVFRFVVAEADGGEIRPVAARQLPVVRPDWDTLALAYGHP